MLDSSILNDINCINEINSIYVDDLINVTFNDNNINVFWVNICSINTNLDKLIWMFSSISDKFDVMILCETWMCTDFNYILNVYCTINLLEKLNKNDMITFFFFR